MDENSSILVVDDDPEVLNVLKNLFEHTGAKCITAPSAEKCLELLGVSEFDVVLTDIVMPGMEGLELTKRIKKEWPDLPVVIMTGYNERFSYEEAVDAGAADFIKKPFNLEELLARLRIVKVHQELKSLAITDELTGIYNRRGFLTLADHLLKLAKRNKTGQFLLYADVDNMKWINDTYGHMEGDRALKEFALKIRGSYRDSDIVARLGGDEFVVFPVGTAGDSIQKIIDRLEVVMNEMNEPNDRRYTLSISYGLAYYDPEDPCSLIDLISKADLEMYKSKKDKKNGS